jgi:arylsulfatase A-like enzyme
MNAILILCDTLRRDHCGPYARGRALNECWSAEQPEWVVPTPNMDRLGAQGTVFTNCYCGSTPCMPARRDIYTGRYEFLERGWGPLEEEDLDLPRQVSGPPNLSLTRQTRDGYPVSSLITDHFHLWEQGSGNYHMGYSGFEFIRGIEADNWLTDPVDFPCPAAERLSKLERHYRNIHLTRRSEEDWFPAQVFTKAADWLRRNRSHESFYLHLDCFAPHEPWDPPEELVRMFDPDGYIEGWTGAVAYDQWERHYTPRELRNIQARYAAQVVLVDRWLGRLWEAMDELDLWRDTMVILTTDHGTYNGDHGRVGKLQTHQHDACAHIPFVVCHPDFGHGEERPQLVQLVDSYPTVLAALGRPCPQERHGINLLPVLEDPSAATRSHAVYGMFGNSVSVTDGRWVLHQSPADAGNAPLNWYGHCLAKFLPYDLGPYVDGRRETRHPYHGAPTWLSDKAADPNELTNLAEREPGKLAEMQAALRAALLELGAPGEQLQRLGLA